MTRRTGSGPAGRNGIAAGLAAAALAAAMLLPAAPSEAGWLGTGLRVAGAARSLKRNLGEAVDLLDDTLGAAVQGDLEEVERLSGELREFPGRIFTDAFLPLSIGAAALEKAEAAGKRLKAARQRIGRFVGDAVADARMALETGEYEIEAGVLDPKRPLPSVTLSGPSGTKRPASASSGASSAPDPWGQDPEEDEETATGKPDPWGQDPKDEEPVARDVDPPGEDGQAGREGGDETIDRLQGEYAAALDRYLSAEEGSSDYESTLNALLEREKELLAGVAGQEEEQELTPDERRRVQACLAEREFDPGTPDGIFGPRTRNAIRAWQASQGWEESGRLNQSSARKLLEECEVAVAEAETAEEDALSKWPPGKKFRDCAECPELVVVPSGEFMMGSPSDETARQNSEDPIHRVTIPQPFAVSVYEITRGEFSSFVSETNHEMGNSCKILWGDGFYETTGSNWRKKVFLYSQIDGNKEYRQTDDHPVVCVSWVDAKTYIKWLSGKTGKEYRLLTESEWEYVARAGTKTAFHTGKTISPEEANYDAWNWTYGSNRGYSKLTRKIWRGRTVSVGSFGANNFGLHDVHGNVWEWVEDCWNGNYTGSPNDGSAWLSGDCSLRVLRGGAWLGWAGNMRSARRAMESSRYRGSNVGFRVARTLN